LQELNHLFKPVLVAQKVSKGADLNPWYMCSSRKGSELGEVIVSCLMT